MPAIQAKRQATTDSQPGQGPDGEVAVAEGQHPEMQQGVVQRRGAVVAEGAGDLAEGQLGDVDAQRLVEPQLGRGEKRSTTPTATRPVATGMA